MKKITFLITIALMSSVMVFGQKKAMHGQRGDFAEKMKQELSLTDQQYASIKEINKNYHPKFRELHERSFEDHESKRNEMQKLRKEKNEKISEVLTKEQNIKWKKVKEEKRKEKREEFKKAHEKRINDLKETLSLSDEQVKKIEQLHKETKKDFRNGDGKSKSKEEAKEQRKLWWDQYRSSMKGILTPEQYEKWESLIKENHNKKKDGHRSPRHKK